jgi:hypothetical protein
MPQSPVEFFEIAETMVRETFLKKGVWHPMGICGSTAKPIEIIRIGGAKKDADEAAHVARTLKSRQSDRYAIMFEVVLTGSDRAMELENAGHVPLDHIIVPGSEAEHFGTSPETMRNMADQAKNAGYPERAIAIIGAAKTGETIHRLIPIEVGPKGKSLGRTMPFPMETPYDDLFAGPKTSANRPM